MIGDPLTGTTSGPALPPDELEKWYDQRNVVNRSVASLGCKNINVNCKPWREGPYGREIPSVKLHQPKHRNRLTTEATARLLTEIVTGRAITPARSKQMRAFLQRRPFDQDAEKQSLEYAGTALLPGSKLWAQTRPGWAARRGRGCLCPPASRGTKRKVTRLSRAARCRPRQGGEWWRSLRFS